MATIEDKIATIILDTGMNSDEIAKLVKKKQDAFKGMLTKQAAVDMIMNDLGVSLREEEKEIEEKTEENEVVDAKIDKDKPITRTAWEMSQGDIIKIEEDEGLPLQQRFKYPSEEELKYFIERKKFLLKNLLDENDFYVTKRGKKAAKKSAWRKYINAFGISIELIEKRVYEQFKDKHCEVRVKAIAPNGQFVEGVGTKSWSELYEKTMHNLIANAWTRAVNRAVSDLVGFGAVSAEELSEYREKENFESLPEKVFEIDED